ncbi:MAG: hypothetical protein UZ22_OP11002000318 [Microgenomates bacterium OLB23]|nr:MAG: hypothetical protein UZ22_OP11002000318 [Microgenomates bacterium OLB23]
MAHNPEKIGSVVGTFQELYPGKKADVLFSCKWTKNVEVMARLLIPIAEHIYLTQFINKDNPDTNRVMRKEDLLSAFEKVGLMPQWFDNPQDAYRNVLKGEPEYLIVTGSFHLLRAIHQS